MMVTGYRLSSTRLEALPAGGGAACEGALFDELVSTPLRDQRHVDAVIKDVIDELERHERRSLGARERKSVEDVIRAAVETPFEAMADAENGSASLSPDAHIKRRWRNCRAQKRRRPKLS
jgi:hypothetical protein